MNWIRGEIAKQKREEKKALQLLAELAVVLGSKVGWDTLAKKMGGVSHHTVEDYVELFDLLFIGKPLYQLDLARRRLNRRKGKKFYFIDGLIYLLSLAINEKWSDIFSRCLKLMAEPQKESRFIELAVFNHLVRRAGGWAEPPLSFFSNSSEIDFIWLSENGLLPLEVKWQNEVSAADFSFMKKLHFKTGLVLSKNRFEQQGAFVAIPVPLFLAVV